MSSSWKPSGPISFHQLMKFGCHASSARWSFLSPARLTLFGMRSSVTTDDIASSSLSSPCAPLRSGSLPVELGALGLSVERQRALLSRCVGTYEDPVLPCGEAREDLRLHRLGAAEAQVLLHARQGIRRHARALLEGDADLVVPVDVVGGIRDKA